MHNQKRKPFLGRPFWRDYVIAYLAIGVGFLIIDIAASLHGTFRTVVLGSGLTLMGLGFLIVACAIVIS